MRAHVGSVVRAVYPGRVAYADEYADYGKTVILDHGSNHFSVSGNLGGLDVQVGEEVRGGEPIGHLGATPRGAVLYFELRRGKETLDPSSCFGI
jgi:septal ring factor EnvC (AmiA/AmiB activator)